MATQNIAYGTETAFATASNLNSLGSAAAKPLGVVDNSSTKAVDYKVYLEITLNSSGVSSTGLIEVYLIEGTEASTGSDFTDGIDPAGTSDIASSIKNAKLLAVLNANANSQVVRTVVDILGDLFGVMRDCPKYFTIVVYNKSGAALPSSTHEATYTAITYTVA
jgi:hypothetical protein